jgi:hypothetical protein
MYELVSLDRRRFWLLGFTSRHWFIRHVPTKYNVVLTNAYALVYQCLKTITYEIFLQVAELSHKSKADRSIPKIMPPTGIYTFLQVSLISACRGLLLLQLRSAQIGGGIFKKTPCPTSNLQLCAPYYSIDKMKLNTEQTMEEKGTLPDIHSIGDDTAPKSPFKRRLAIVTTFLLCYLSVISLLKNSYDYSLSKNPDSAGKHRSHSSSKCPQMDALFPGQTTKELDLLDDYLQTENFKNESIARLSGAVKIPTMSFDDMGKIGEDKRWDIFYEFAQYLKDTFPQVHAKLDLDVVNVHGLVYSWKGSDDSLKPTLLMAHQDVVPVPESTIPSWTHPPFDGVFDGKFIWGRGASDCKNSLIAIMESIELLVAADFQPKRSIVMSFGFDEEISGTEGAGHLAPFLLEKYGKDAFAIIIDEGAGVNTLWGTHFATPGVAEKGYVDVEIVSTSGPCSVFITFTYSYQRLCACQADTQAFLPNTTGSESPVI